MEASSFSGGGFAVPENYVPELIELLRPRSVANVITANRTVNLQNVDLDLGKLILALFNANVMLDNH